MFAILITGATYDEVFDPSDYSVISIENVNNVPFVAKIRNNIVGRTYDFVPGDYIGPHKMIKVTENNIVLEDKLTKKKYFLPVPISYLEEKMTQKAKEEHQLLFEEAKRLFRIGKAKSAAKKLIEAIKGNPGYESAHFLLAIIYHENRLYKDAFLHYKEAVPINPKKYRAYYNMAQLFSETGNFKEALYYVRKTLVLKPDYEKGLNLYANIMDEIEQEEKEKGTMQSVAERQRKKEKVKSNVKRIADQIRKIKIEIEVMNTLKKKEKMTKENKKKLQILEDDLKVKESNYDSQTERLKKLMEK